MKERILEFLRHENKTSSQFAEDIGVQPSSVSHIISGRNKPSLDFVVKMLQKYSTLSTDWLIFGKGTMFTEQSTNELFSDFSDEISNVIVDNPDKDINQAAVKEAHKPSSDLSFDSGVDDEKRLEKLILIFSDNSFKEYKPGQDRH